MPTILRVLEHSILTIGDVQGEGDSKAEFQPAHWDALLRYHDAGADLTQTGQVVGSQGGELYVLGKAEFRFPAIGQIDLGVFFEAGNLWLESPNAFTLRTVAGAGVRYMTPIGPLALDVGVNLAPDRWINEPPVNLHFNIGYF